VEPEHRARFFLHACRVVCRGHVVQGVWPVLDHQLEAGEAERGTRPPDVEVWVPVLVKVRAVQLVFCGLVSRPERGPHGPTFAKAGSTYAQPILKPDRLLLVITRTPVSPSLSALPTCSTSPSSPMSWLALVDTQATMSPGCSFLSGCARVS